jgi:diacylglycerol kinase family enzyme
MSSGTALILAAAVIVIGAVVLWGRWRHQSIRRHIRAIRRGRLDLLPFPGHRSRAVVIANATKVRDRDALRSSIDVIGAELGFAPVTWRETTEDDSGSGPAGAAVRENVDLVFAFGGDGTVRNVAAELAGTTIPLALLPAGTGNLLARNLEIPVGHRADAIALGFSGQDRRIDVGRAEVDRSGEDEVPRHEAFLVMAGLGFDAEIMASVEPGLKMRMGWWAYVVAGARLIRGPQTKVTLYLDDGPAVHRRVRTVVVGNCGSLTGGILLLPDARPDDGWLDVVAISPRGMVGWAAVTASVVSRMRRGHPLVERFRCRRVEIRAEKPVHMQLDGDPAGRARVLRATVDPGTLLIRVPEVAPGPSAGSGPGDPEPTTDSSGPAVTHRHRPAGPNGRRNGRDPAERITRLLPTVIPVDDNSVDTKNQE